MWSCLCLLFPFVQSVRPFLHHGATLIEIGGVVVGTTHVVLVGMGKLRFDGIGISQPAGTAANASGLLTGSFQIPQAIPAGAKSA